MNIQKDYTPDSLLQLRSSDAIQYFEIHLKDIPQEGVDRTLVLALFKKIAMSYRTEVDLSLNISNLSRSTFARIGLWI